jgi:hypothetical protein
MGRSRSKDEKKEKCVQDFDGKSEEKRPLIISRRIILKMPLEKLNGMEWTGFT